MDNPFFLSVGFHAAGGVARGSFYVPLKCVPAWACESAWLAQGIAAWGIMPLLVADASLDQWTEVGRNPDGTANEFNRVLSGLPRTGYVRLQDHGSPVSCRNIYVKRLDNSR